MFFELLMVFKREKYIPCAAEQKQHVASSQARTERAWCESLGWEVQLAVMVIVTGPFTCPVPPHAPLMSHIREGRQGEAKPSPPYNSSSRALPVSHQTPLCGASFCLNTLLRAVLPEATVFNISKYVRETMDVISFTA